MASTAASNYTASPVGNSSNYGASTIRNDLIGSKFSDYRSRVMLGDLPQDFLRIQFTQAQMYDPAAFGMRQAYGSIPQQQLLQNPNFLGHFTLTIAEAKLVKNSGLLGLIKMDPYVSFRIGHVAYDTPTANSGGKNPQWKTTYRINLFKGMDNIHVEVFDQRNFTEDSFIGECEVAIPREVMEGETTQHWYPLMGRQANANENQGDILIIMSFVLRDDQIIFDQNPRHQNDLAVRGANQPAAANGNGTPFVNPNGNEGAPTGATASSIPSQATKFTEQQPTPQHSPSVTPKPPPPPYSPEDVRTIEEMFPTTDRRLITDLLDEHAGNKDFVVNQLLQNIA